ncbi:MAG: biopolymer transporter ExbD [Prochloraceae cyanobacterium]|nr:biopolymer transporter ExbD [Prochloraceae cyanobacterium]
MRLNNEPDRPPQINIVPMIDVIFVILVYFIISTLFLTRSETLPVNLPQAETAQLQKTKQITVSLDKEGNLAVDRKPTQLDRLKAQVESLIEPKQTTVVVISADELANHGKVVDIVDRLRKIPTVKLGIATTKKEEKN